MTLRTLVGAAVLAYLALALVLIATALRAARLMARPVDLRARALAAANARDNRRRHSRHVRRWRWR